MKWALAAEIVLKLSSYALWATDPEIIIFWLCVCLDKIESYFLCIVVGLDLVYVDGIPVSTRFCFF